MGAVKRVFATLGLLLFLCSGTTVQAQEKIAAYPPFALGYISIKVFDSQARFVGRILPERRYWTSIDQIPIFLQNALVAIEDSRFYEHGGPDLAPASPAPAPELQPTNDRSLPPHQQ
jgi:membrane peptidoglycan carboxypeptidase